MRCTRSLICLFVLLAALPRATAQGVPVPSGVVGWWKGEDLSDELGVTPATLFRSTSFGPGKVGNAFTFSSDGSGVDVAHNVEGLYDVMAPGFTVEFWMRGVKDFGQTYFIAVDKSHGWVDSAGCGFQGDPRTGRIDWFIGAGGPTYPPPNFVGVTSPTDVLDNNWHHVAGTWGAATGQLILYVDGVPYPGPTLMMPANNTRDLHFGYSWGCLIGLTFRLTGSVSYFSFR